MGTTDIQRALHPPDKQDVAKRMLLEVQRMAYGMPVISRGPELVSHSVQQNTLLGSTELTLTFSNSTLVTHEGIFVGKTGVCTTPFQQQTGSSRVAVPYKIAGAHVTVTCQPGQNATVLVNSDNADCFLYSAQTGLP